MAFDVSLRDNGTGTFDVALATSAFDVINVRLALSRTRSSTYSNLIPPAAIGSGLAEVISDRVRTAIVSRSLARLASSAMTVSGFTKVPYVEPEPPPPEPPQIPTSPPPLRLGGGSAW
jgi:hypothetical protein